MAGNTKRPEEYLSDEEKRLWRASKWGLHPMSNRNPMCPGDWPKPPECWDLFQICRALLEHHLPDPRDDRRPWLVTIRNQYLAFGLVTRKQANTLYETQADVLGS